MFHDFPMRQVVNSLRRSVEDRQQAFHELDSLNKGEDVGILGHKEMMAFF